MDAPLPLIKAFLPKVPMLGRTALWHTLGLSEHASHWDLRTELTISVLRSFIVDSPPETISNVQSMSLKDMGIKGRIWISKVSMAIPAENNVRQALFSAIEGLKQPGSEKGGYPEPEARPVTAEWTGYRAGATRDSRQLRITEESKYKEMMREVTSPATVLYFHGGAYYLMDPASHRITCKKLAKLTKGRCFNVRYRLAPQNPFPAALLDALVSYLTLLYPPAGSYHQAVLPEHIVFAGDSAGGGLSAALLQTLLELWRQHFKVTWDGVEHDVPLPAGMALCSPWFDVTHSLPSCETNKIYDYLPPPSIHPSGMAFPTCPLWPSPPPRKNLYAEDHLLTHPLVSPLAATSWAAAPPIFIQTGQELLSDESKHVARLAAAQGVAVHFEEYETMPHCFSLLLTDLPASKMFTDHWAGFVAAAATPGRELRTKMVRYKVKSLQVVDLDPENLVDFTADDVKRWMARRLESLSAKQPDALSKL